ncbi:MAG: hypothetical protein QOE33_206 [Acidobacteriota bacterium]|nr:hypothetical protein [Acidobacteriota bacterium]
MLKKILRTAVSGYLFPFRLNERLFHYAKSAYFTSTAEHLFRATAHIKARGGPRDGEIIIDIGGADGSTTRYFAGEFQRARVFCFEPNTRMLPALAALEASNERVTVKRLALGSTRGESVLHVTANNLSSSLNEPDAEELSHTPPEYRDHFRLEAETRVEVSTLDDEFEGHPRVLLIKMDTQGTELDILKGGPRTLEKTRFVLAEMNNHHLYKNTCQYYEVDDFLRGAGFKLADIVVTFRGDEGVTEYDALYENTQT